MTRQTMRTGRSLSAARRIALIALLVMTLGVIPCRTLAAPEPQRPETGTDALSLSTEHRVVALAEPAAAAASPDVAGCPVTALASDGSGSPNERAPNSNFLYGRSVWLITAAEASANGLVNGTIPSAIGFRYAAAPGVVATGSLKVYLQNTSDTTNTKSTNWVTAITGMNLVHNGTSTSLPNTTAPFDIPFSGTGISSFTYTGGGLYVAFDWSWTGPVTSVAVVASNTVLIGGLKGSQSNTSPPTTLAAVNFRPETRFTPSTATVFNDASVDFVIALGSLPQSLVGPQTVQAIVTNKGVNALNNVPVTLSVTGAQTTTSMQNVAGPLAACGGQAVVTFAPFTLTALGSDTVTVSVPSDDGNMNNSKSRPMDSTAALYSYKHPATTAAGGVGVTNGTGDIMAKFKLASAAKITAINLEFFNAGAAYRAAVYPESSPGSGVPGLTPLYEDAADRTATAGAVSITLPSPVPVGPGTFFAGIEQTGTTNASLSFDNEVPIRSGAFYLAIPHPPTSWLDESPGNDFKVNVGVTLSNCATAADCNDGNACTDDTCVSGICTHAGNSNLIECDGNPCSNPDHCSNGTCLPGPNPCNDNNACTTDLCDGQGGCTHPAVSCDDGNPCTSDSCDPSSGCAHADNTSPCNDGNPCTIGDKCGNGACVPGTGALPAPVQLCNNGSITINDFAPASPYPSAISVTGQPSYLCSMSVNLNGLTHTFVADVDILLARPTGNNAIILSDVGGTSGVSNVNLTLTDAATASLPAGPFASGTYKPTNIGAGDTFAAPAPAPTGGSPLATFGGVDPNGTWNLWVVDDSTNDAGTLAGWCVSLVSVCVSSADCGDGNPCTDDACTLGVCTHTHNTSPCNDNNACTASDTCSGGVCVGGPPPPCDDGNACTANACNPQTGQCENPPIVCNDGNPCTDDSCNPSVGCVFTPNDQNTCSDNSLCTGPDVCRNGVCVGQNPLFCPPDANVCTTETCDPSTGHCVSLDNTVPCDDGNACTLGDACGPTLAESFDGVAAPAIPSGWTTQVSGTGNPWTTVDTSSDSAPNSAFGFDGPALADEVLISPAVPIRSASATLAFRNRWSFEGTTSYFDGSVLEISIDGADFTDIVAAGGSFTSGGYTGSISSSFGNPLAGRPAWTGMSAGYPSYLTTVVTLPAAAAGKTIQLQFRLGTDSSTGALGQNIDSILLRDGTNVCNPGPGTPSCDDGNPCTDDYCDPQLGCRHANNTNACDDGNACTAPDTCVNGACAGTPIVCNDSNPCTNDSCNPGTGCVFAPITAPPETHDVVAAANKTTYSWSAATYATQYDVVRGAASALPVGPGAADEVCFDNLPAPSVNDPAVPAPGAGFWYLSRGENSCGIGTYGTQSNGTPRTTTTCP